MRDGEVIVFEDAADEAPGQDVRPGNVEVGRTRPPLLHSPCRAQLFPSLLFLYLLLLDRWCASPPTTTLARWRGHLPLLCGGHSLPRVATLLLLGTSGGAAAAAARVLLARRRRPAHDHGSAPLRRARWVRHHHRARRRPPGTTRDVAICLCAHESIIHELMRGE